MAEIGLVATLPPRSCCDSPGLPTFARGAHWLEVNADWAAEIDLARWRGSFSGKLIYCLCNGGQIGASESMPQRMARLRAAVMACDLIEVDARQDDFHELLSIVPVEKRMISWAGIVGGVDELHRKFKDLSRYPARFYKLVSSSTNQASDGLIPLSLLKSLGRSDVVAYAAGPSGFWSRIVAPQLGSPFVYGAAEESSGASEPSVAQLVAAYGFPSVKPVSRLYGIVGKPVLQSFSPRLHNAAYRSLGVPALFVPFHAESFDDFWENLVQRDGLEQLGFALCGMTVVSPYKEAALRVAMTCSAAVRQAGSANVLTRNGDGNRWRAETTDPESLLGTDHELGIPLSPKKVAVIGCGGAGRAVAAALHHAGADVTLVNRGKERGSFAAKLLGLSFIPLAQFDPTGFSVLVNATPVGRDGSRLPIEVSHLNPGATVIDLAYGKQPTPLVTEAALHGCTVINGYDVLVAQVRSQFKIMIDADMPEVRDARVVESTSVAASLCVSEYATMERNADAAS